MGVKYSAEDSSNLISAMRNNVSTAKAIVDRLNAGAQHLISHLDDGVLQGAAYAAGRGLFSDFILPGIAKLGQAVDDVHAELASYEHAHSVVAEYGDLDLDDLQRASRDARDQLELVETQIEVNEAFAAQVTGLPGVATFSAERFDLAAQTHSLEQLRFELEEEIRRLDEKINKLEWFTSDVSSYFSDSLQAMQLAAQAAIELGKVTVDVDGSYSTNGVNVVALRRLIRTELVTSKSSIETMVTLYGFTEREAALVLLAQKSFVSSDQHADEHEFLAVMASLCHNYRATRWTITADTVPLDRAKTYLSQLGLSSQDIDALIGGINRQHTEATDSGKKDFAHEMVGLAIFTFPREMSTAGFMDRIMSGQLDEFSSYKGDAASSRFGLDDMRSDTDMINIYRRSLRPEITVLQAIEAYHEELASGSTNRAQELVDTLGGGDFEKLRSVLTSEVMSYNLGDEYMAKLPHLNTGLTSGPTGIDPWTATRHAEQLEKYRERKRRSIDEYSMFLKNELLR